MKLKKKKSTKRFSEIFFSFLLCFCVSVHELFVFVSLSMTIRAYLKWRKFRGFSRF